MRRVKFLAENAQPLFPTKRNQALLLICCIFCLVVISSLIPQEPGRNVKPHPTHVKRLPHKFHNLTEILTDLRLHTQYIRALKHETNETTVDELRRLLFPWIYQSPELGGSWEGLKKKTSGGGRGIVISLGSWYYLLGLNLIQSLRLSGCTLPIQIWHDDDLADRKKEYIKQKFPDVTLIRINSVLSPAMNIRGWDTKAFIMLASNFDEPMVIDADVIFVKNPELLYEQANYTKYGTSFWYDRDYIIFGGHREKKGFLEKIVPPPWSQNILQSRWFLGQTGYQLESGVVLMNKTKTLFGLLTICNLNTNIPRDILHNGSAEVLLWGDKERFWLGMEVAAEEFGYYPTPAASLSKDGATCGRVAHLDEGNELYWFNDGIVENKRKGINTLANVSYIVHDPKGMERGKCDSGTVSQIPEETLEITRKLHAMFIEMNEETKKLWP